MTTRTRILALLSSVLLFSVAATGFALFTLVRADDELHRVAGHDVPLLKVVNVLNEPLALEGSLCNGHVHQ